VATQVPKALPTARCRKTSKVWANEDSPLPCLPNVFSPRPRPPLRAPFDAANCEACGDEDHLTRTIWHAPEPVHQPQEGSGSNLLQARLTALRMAEKYCPTTASFLSSFFARNPREGLLPLMHLCDQLNAACVCNRSARPSNAAHGPHSRLVVSPVGASPTCVLSCVCSRVCALVCVLSCVCSRVCALVSVLSC